MPNTDLHQTATDHHGQPLVFDGTHFRRVLLPECDLGRPMVFGPSEGIIRRIRRENAPSTRRLDGTTPGLFGR